MNLSADALHIKVLPLRLLAKDVKEAADEMRGRPFTEEDDLYWIADGLCWHSSEKMPDLHYRVYLSPKGAKLRRKDAKAAGFTFNQVVAIELYEELIGDWDTMVALIALSNHRLFRQKAGGFCWDLHLAEREDGRITVNEEAMQMFTSPIEMDDLPDDFKAL